MSENQVEELLPFHGSIVEALYKIRDVRDREGLMALGWLITRTVIPENHDNIRYAWADACNRVGGMDLSFDCRVLGSVVVQKGRAQKKAEEKATKETEETVEETG